MAVSKTNVVNSLETWFPRRYAEDWDNVGWMVEPRSETVDRVLVSVDSSRDAIEAARSKNVDLLISHHPLIFEPLSAILRSNPTDRMVSLAIREDLGIYCAHTNADAAPGGLNDRLADIIGLQSTKPIDEGEEQGVGLGRVGRLPEDRTVGWVEERLIQTLTLRHTWSTVEKHRIIRNVGICSGSGGDFVGPDLAEQVDLYISGDVGHHTALEARQIGLPLLVLDHYDMETVFCDLVRERIGEEYGSSLTVLIYRRSYPYRHRMGEAEDQSLNREEPR